jgi:hypothetical protein
MYGFWGKEEGAEESSWVALFNMVSQKINYSSP